MRDTFVKNEGQLGASRKKILELKTLFLKVDFREQECIPHVDFSDHRKIVD